MKIYNNNLIKDLNDDKYYNKSENSVNLALNFAKNMTDKYSEPLNFFAYWVGDNLSYKHQVVIKSFLATQSNNCSLLIYSDIDLSNNENIKPYLKYGVKTKIFNVYEETKNTILADFKYNDNIKNHTFSPDLESDFFRILMLHKYGGVYIDFDVLLLRDFSPLLNYEFVYQFGSDDFRANGAVMRIKKNSDISNIAINLMKISYPTVIGKAWQLVWAADLYNKIREINTDLIVFPCAFFNTEWQLAISSRKFFIESDYNLYDGAFAWHWHNQWNTEIMKNSKFDILDKILTEKFEKKINI
jgi:CRISPR/Cas system-associated endonuclease/helicase Cas3